MPRIVIRSERCKSCGWCVEVCPQHSITIGSDTNPVGYHYAAFRDGGRCTGCARCAVMCPDICIEVFREADAAPEGGADGA